MVQLQSFEGEVTHSPIPEQIISKMGHVVCEGVKEASWNLPGHGTVCVLHSYEQFHTLVDGEQVVLEQPHYLLYGTYKHKNDEHDEAKDASLLASYNAEGMVEQVRGAHADFWRDEEGSRHNYQVRLDFEKADLMLRIIMQAGMNAADEFMVIQAEREERTKKLREDWERKRAEEEKGTGDLMPSSVSLEVVLNCDEY